MTKVYLTLGIISIVVVATAIYAFTQVGTPGLNRALELDSERISNLTSIKSAIQTYHTKNKTLPANLDDLIKESSYLKIKDPKTDTQYEYSITSQNSYKLCATFAIDSDDKKVRRGFRYFPSGYTNKEFKHPKGHHCFDFQVKDYSSSREAIQTPRTEVFIQDEKILKLATNAKKIDFSNSRFPDGFFNDKDEWGLINNDSSTVTLTATFIKPVKIKSISNLFTGCSSKCYVWTATGKTKDDRTISLMGPKTVDGGVESKEEIILDDEIKEVSITATHIEGNRFVHWKKIKLEYK